MGHESAHDNAVAFAALLVPSMYDEWGVPPQLYMPLPAAYVDEESRRALRPGRAAMRKLEAAWAVEFGAILLGLPGVATNLKGSVAMMSSANAAPAEGAMSPVLSPPWCGIDEVSR